MNNSVPISRREFLKKVGGTAAAVGVAGATLPGCLQPTQKGKGQEVVCLADQVIGTIDPAKHTDWTETAAVINFYEPLLTVDPETFKPKPNVAKSWTVEQGGEKWTFDLREGIPFQSGNTLTADDVVYSMKRMLSLGLGYSSLWEGVLKKDGVSAVDDHTVSFTLEKPFGPFLATLVQLFIVDSKKMKKNEKEQGDYGEHGDYAQAYLKNNVAGSGPYKLESWSSGNKMVFTKFDNYWKEWEENQFDSARMEIVKEPSTIKLMLKQGKADLTSTYQDPSLYKEASQDKDVKLYKSPQLQLFHLPINTQKKPTDDINVRKAIAHAFDYKTAINEIFAGWAVRAEGSVPIKMPGHKDNLDPYQQNLDKAKQALDNADYSVDEINNMGLEQVFVAGISIERKMALLLQDNLKEIGITNVKNNPQQWATITERATKKEKTPHITHIYHTAKYPSPDGHTFMMYHPSAFGSYISMSWYTTDELTQILEEARRTPNLDERLNKYKQAQQIIYEGYPSVFIANPLYKNALNKNLGGFSYCGVMSFEYNWHTMYRKGKGRSK